MSTSESAVNQLLALAKDHFGDDFDSGDTGVDTKFFTAMADGTLADYVNREGGKDANDPAKAEEWGRERVLQANRIEWLCTDAEAAALVSRKGIQIRGARIDGELDLSSVRFDRSLYFEKCAFVQRPDFADASFIALYLPGTHCPGIRSHRLHLEGNLFLRDDFKAEGEVNLCGASIGGQLACDGGSFLNKGGTAFNADGLTVAADVFLSDNFKAEGEVNLRGASISGQLACVGGSFLNKGGTAINADAITVGANVLLRDDFRAEGEVNLSGASIGGQFNCSGGSFLNKDGTALHANKISVTTDVLLLDGFRAEGEVNLIGARIGGQLACAGGSFLNKDGMALNCEAIKVKGDVYVCLGFRAEGDISFVLAEIEGGLQYREIDEPEKATLNLRHAKVGVLWDDPKSWPEAGNLLLRGFEYERLDDQATVDATQRIDWLSRDGGDGFSPKPYEQLAKVLTRSDHPAQARAIRIEKKRRLAKEEWERREYRSWKRIFGLGLWCWDFFYGKLTDYGYRPWKLLPVSVFIILIGWPLYEVAYAQEWITPTRVHSKLPPYNNEGAVYPTFQGLAYSLDAFVPLVNIEQVDYWLANAYRGPRWEWPGGYYVSCSGVLLFFYYFQVVFGWMVTTWIAVVLTDLLRRED